MAKALTPRVAQTDHHIVREHPAVGGNPLEVELAIRLHVPYGPSDQGAQQRQRARGRNLSSRNEPFEQRDEEGAAGAAYDDGLDVGLAERPHVTVHGGDEEENVQQVLPHASPRERLHRRQPQRAEQEHPRGGGCELARRDEAGERDRREQELVREQQGGGAE
eukprot:CAMPEP_0205854072 /NCGR_PEP_ID=MMETSP1083-20121108/1889_1 /ASSEMBLY_ACC=CAM_ASM_000430 /TAXON_ID=97485 /ORGANISM="Prymnesium parvum, Strain Texoma1" /LENGTH=162 /DNA_ID=CAMNT_0053215381 /DNA_START=592 /DNA_END=1077 /DNA_ORIENTATION=-